MARRAHNKMIKIKDQDGIERESHKEIETTLVNHFHGIAQEPNQDITEAIQRIIHHIPHLVTEEQNNNLNKPIVEEEIDQVLQEMPNGKAQLTQKGYDVIFEGDDFLIYEKNSSKMLIARVNMKKN
jgi:c-di-AMP phosphodiesterase-like protein